MDIITKQDMQSLTEHSDQHCISLYLPTYRTGQRTDEPPIRYKNLLARTKERLQQEGLRPSEAENILRPAYQFLNPNYSIFWKYQSDGLALFISPGFFKYYRLPYHFEDFLDIGTRFHIKPLIPVISYNKHFFILALSQHNIRLMSGTHYSISEIDLKNVPRNISEALKYDNPEKELQYHTETGPHGNPASEHGRPAMFHGQGSVVDGRLHKRNILRFFQKINHGIHRHLNDEISPLILSGVEFLLPIYREANTYNNVLDTNITGNPDTLKPQELHSKAWPVVKEYFAQEQKNDITKYYDLSNTSRTTTDIRTIIKAAHEGRVETLFLTKDVNIWGNFDPANYEIEIQDNKTNENIDILDLAAIYTRLHDGKIYVLEPDQMPEGAVIAATLRY